ncbi:MAG: hypothetical protein HY720_00490 [Planctomycetes bacterium]|nr:hypothetical protein [Planctomycetota bacterium]
MAKREKLGSYRLVRRLASDDRATSYAAKDGESDRAVTVWVLSRKHSGREGFADELRRRVERARRLGEHARILPVIEHGFDGKFHFVVAGHFDGEILARRLRKRGPLPEKDALAVALDVCRALVHAHAAGVSHGSVGPDRVVLLAGGGALLDGFWLPPEIQPDKDERILDLAGVGRVLAAALTGTPESAVGDEVSGRTRRLVLELLRPEGPPPMEGPAVLAARIEEAMHGPSSAPVLGKATPRARHGESSRAAALLSLGALVAGLAAGGFILAGLAGDGRTDGDGMASGADPNGAGSGAGGAGGPDGVGSRSDGRPLAASPFGIVEPGAGGTGPGPEPPAGNGDVAPGQEEDGEDDADSRAQRLAAERREAEELLHGDRIASLRERMDFLLDVYRGTPLEADVAALREEMTLRGRERIRDLFRKIQEASRSNRREEVERLARLIEKEGDRFAQYRALQILAMNRERE